MLKGGFRKNLRRHWVEGNSEVRLTEETADHKLKENMLSAKKLKDQTFIMTLNTVKKNNQYKREKPGFQPMKNKFFNNLSHYQKTAQEFELMDEKPTLNSSISYVETLIELLAKSEKRESIVI
jgi:hypothetical protein